METQRIGRVALVTESYPPMIDGVSVAAVNYAKYLEEKHEGAVVVTQRYRDPSETHSPAPVIWYDSFDMEKQLGYPIGKPMSPAIVAGLDRYPPGIIHMMSPMISSFVGRELREVYHVPHVLTYHTKYDEDIDNLVPVKPVAKLALTLMMDNIRAADEVWAVSEGAAENLRGLGYEREIVLMPNGTDLPRGRATEAEIREVCGRADLPAGVPVLLFLGRITRVKGLDSILDAVCRLKATGEDFRMVFVGDGLDREYTEDRAKALGIMDRCVFNGPEKERSRLRAWYTRADLFVFPSTFDTNGLVVREAAAASTPALLIRGSAAAEGITDGRNGFLVETGGQALAERIMALWHRREYLREVGRNASEEIYLSWEDAVEMAWARYGVVRENWLAGRYPSRASFGDRLLRPMGKRMVRKARKKTI